MPVVRMEFLENTSINWITTCAWEIRYTRRWGWLEKLCRRFLDWTGCLRPHFDKEQMAHCVAIDTDGAAEEIIRLAGYQMELVGLKPERILMGRAQFDAMTNTAVAYRRPFEFVIQIKVGRNMGPYDSHVTVHGVPVQVVPWMDGILVL